MNYVKLWITIVHYLLYDMFERTIKHPIRSHHCLLVRNRQTQSANQQTTVVLFLYLLSPRKSIKTWRNHLNAISHHMPLPIVRGYFGLTHHKSDFFSTFYTCIPSSLGK